METLQYLAMVLAAALVLVAGDAMATQLRKTVSPATATTVFLTVLIVMGVAFTLALGVEFTLKAFMLSMALEAVILAIRMARERCAWLQMGPVAREEPFKE